MGTAKYSTALLRRRWAKERRSQMLQNSLWGVPATPKVCRAHWIRPLSALSAWVGRGGKKMANANIKMKNDNAKLKIFPPKADPPLAETSLIVILIFCHSRLRGNDTGGVISAVINQDAGLDL